jgi:hypothetical protein
MRRSLLVLALVLCLASPARGAYDHASGGAASPAAVTVGGGTGYSVSITGKPAAVDIVFVLDNSGSMSESFDLSSKWAALSSVTKSFVNELNAGGFFARGGKVGVVLFSETAVTATAPTADLTAIANGIDSGGPTSSSCIGCGLQRAAELLTAIPGSTTHKRIAYLVADGENTMEPPTLAEALAADNAAGVERRVIGLGSAASIAGLEALDSDGLVPYPTSAVQLNSDYTAEPTKFPGATNLSWAFHLTPGFAASAPAASKGSVAIAGSDVTWTIPSLAEETATLSFNATHAASSGCAATALLSGTSFSDAQGDAAPAVPLGPLSLSGCPGGGKSEPTPSSVILLPKASSKCSHRRSLALKIRPPAGVGVAKVSVKVTGRKAKIYNSEQAKGTIKLTGLPAGRYKVKVTVTLSEGRTLTLTRSYRTCAPKRRS